MKDIVKAFPKDVRVAIKQYPLPFHKQAMPAAKAALAAQRQGKFWEMTDILYKNYRALADDKYKDLAKQLGLNVKEFEKDMKDPAIDTEIKQHMDEAKRIGVRGTPSFFMNGRVMRPEGRTLEGLKKLIEQEIKKPAEKKG